MLRGLFGRGASGCAFEPGTQAAKPRRYTGLQFSAGTGGNCRWFGHFLLTVDVPEEARIAGGGSSVATRLDAPADHYCAEDWHVGFEPGPVGDDPAQVPRRKPDYCLKRWHPPWPRAGCAGSQRIASQTLSFKSFARSLPALRASKIGGRYRRQRPATLGSAGFGARKRPCPGHAAMP